MSRYNVTSLSSEFESFKNKVFSAHKCLNQRWKITVPILIMVTIAGSWIKKLILKFWNILIA